MLRLLCLGKDNFFLKHKQDPTNSFEFFVWQWVMRGIFVERLVLFTMLSRISAGGDFNFGFHLEMIHQRARWEVPCRLIPRLMLAHAPSAEVGWPNLCRQNSTRKVCHGSELDQGEFSCKIQKKVQDGPRIKLYMGLMMGPCKWPKMKRKLGLFGFTWRLAGVVGVITSCITGRADFVEWSYSLPKKDIPGL